MLNLKKKFIVVFEPTRKPDAGQNPGANKIPFPLRAWDKNYLLQLQLAPRSHHRRKYIS